MRNRRRSHPKLLLACLLAVFAAATAPRGRAHSSPPPRATSLAARDGADAPGDGRADLHAWAQAR